ncbi:MAG: hypothetical protein ACYC6C_06785 [Coriobacteriia bacterium]
MGFISSEKSADANTQSNSGSHGTRRKAPQFRAIDAATQLYAATEHAHRRARFELALTRAQTH